MATTKRSAAHVSGTNTRGATAARLQALEATASKILGQLDLEETLQSLITEAVDLIGADVVGIMLLDEDGEVLRMRACRGHRHAVSARLTVRQGEGLAGAVLASGRPYRIADYRADPVVMEHFREIVDREGTRSAVGAPMSVRGTVIGTLMAWSRHPEAFSAADEEVMVGLANLATIAIENSRLFEVERSAVHRLEDANRQLQEQFAMLQRATAVQERLTELVLKGIGLGDLVSTVATHLEGDAVVLDPHGSVIAATAEAGAIAGRIRHHLGRRPGLADLSASTDALLEPVESYPRWVLVRQVTAGDDPLGHLGVSFGHPPTALDPVIVEQAAIVCALALTKQRAVLDAKTRERNDFLWDLLDGTVGDAAEAAVRLQYVGYPLPLLIRVIQVLVDPKPADHAPVVDLTDQQLWAEILVRAENLTIEHSRYRPLVARRGSAIALVVPWQPEPPGSKGPTALPVAAARRMAEQLAGGLGEAFPDLEFRGGTSSCLPLTRDLRAAWSQACSALAVATATEHANGPAFALYDELGAARFLLSPGDPAALKAWAYAVLGPLLDYDARHDSDLVDTVDAYLAADGNLSRAAERLTIHAKTVRYRLDRVESMSGRDLSSQADRFDIQMAISVIRLLKLGSAPDA